VWTVNRELGGLGDQREHLPAESLTLIGWTDETYRQSQLDDEEQRHGYDGNDRGSTPFGHNNTLTLRDAASWTMSR